jgi:hypothetical protein
VSLDGRFTLIPAVEPLTARPTAPGRIHPLIKYGAAVRRRHATNGRSQSLSGRPSDIRRTSALADDAPFVVANRMAACSADMPPDRPETGTDERRFMACAVQRRRFPSGCKPHPAPAPAGSNRSNRGGNEAVEAFGEACHESVTARVCGP